MSAPLALTGAAQHIVSVQGHFAMPPRILLKDWLNSGAMFIGITCGAVMAIIWEVARVPRESGTLGELYILGAGLGLLISLAVVFVRSRAPWSVIVLGAQLPDHVLNSILIGTLIGVAAFGIGITLECWPLSWFGLSVSVVPSTIVALCVGVLGPFPYKRHAR